MDQQPSTTVSLVIHHFHGHYLLARPLWLLNQEFFSSGRIEIIQSRHTSNLSARDEQEQDRTKVVDSITEHPASRRANIFWGFLPNWSIFSTFHYYLPFVSYAVSLFSTSDPSQEHALGTSSSFHAFHNNLSQREDDDKKYQRDKEEREWCADKEDEREFKWREWEDNQKCKEREWEDDQKCKEREWEDDQKRKERRWELTVREWESQDQDKRRHQDAEAKQLEQDKRLDELERKFDELERKLDRLLEANNISM